MAASRTAQPDIRLRVVSDPRLLCAIRGVVRGYFSNLGLGRDEVDSVILAVDEACSNSIRHAYENKSNGVVELTFCLDGEFAEVVVRDFGKPAKPAVLEKSVQAASPQSFPRGGFGVRFMRAIFDEVEFVSGKRRGNCVRLRLKCPERYRLCPEPGREEE